MLNSIDKQKLIEEHRINEKDTGSVEIQIALLSKKITQILDHLKISPKDNHSRMGLLKMVGKRKGFLNYLFKSDNKSYSALIKKLGLKK